MWKIYAILSVVFAALTAIRTLVILLITWGVVFFSGALSDVKEISGKIIVFLVLSGITTGLSWLFYFKTLQLGDASKVAPNDKLSVALTIFLAIIIMGEPAAPKVIIGGTPIVGGTMVIIW